MEAALVDEVVAQVVEAVGEGDVHVAGAVEDADLVVFDEYEEAGLGQGVVVLGHDGDSDVGGGGVVPQAGLDEEVRLWDLATDAIQYAENPELLVNLSSIIENSW